MIGPAIFCRSNRWTWPSTSFLSGGLCRTGGTTASFDPVPPIYGNGKRRLFGWAPRLGCFIVVCGRMKKDLRRPGNYDPFMRAAGDFRDPFDLDPPKSIQPKSIQPKSLQEVTIDAVF